jgi:hypothetical protein
MPNRLPTPGSDSGNWGTILNSYLNTTLSDTGGINTCDVVYLDDADIMANDKNSISGVLNTLGAWVLNFVTQNNTYTIRPVDYVLNKKTGSLFKLTKSGDVFTVTRVSNIPHTFSVVNIQTGSIFRRWSDPSNSENTNWYIISSNNVINVKDYGARGDNKIDDSDALQAAIDAYKTGYINSSNTVIYIARTILIPAGKFRITKPLNITTGKHLDRNITNVGYDHFGIKIIGEGRDSYGSIIAGDTGGVMFDCTGTSGLCISDLGLSSGTTNPSTVGILLARGLDSGYCHNNVIDNVMINIDTNFTANGGLGSVGIWNVAGEQHIYNKVFIWANLPLGLTVNSNAIFRNFSESGFVASFYKIESAYTPVIIEEISLGVVSVTGASSLYSLNFYRPCVYLNGVNSVNLDNVYMGVTPGNLNKDTTGTYKSAFEVWNAFNFRHTGTIEGAEQYMHSPRGLVSADINVIIAHWSQNAPSIPLINITPDSNQSGAGLVSNSIIRLNVFKPLPTYPNHDNFFGSELNYFQTLINTTVYGTNKLPANIANNSKNTQLYANDGTKNILL